MVSTSLGLALVRLEMSKSWGIGMVEEWNGGMVDREIPIDNTVRVRRPVSVTSMGYGNHE